MNPTTAVLEERIAQLEGGLAAVAVSSGQAASAFAIQNLCKAGDNIVSSPHLYGGTWNLFANTMKDLGILQKYIPEFGEVVGQMQFDLFHVYTVDEHTFKLVRNMRQMKLHEEEGFEIEHELINKIPKIEILSFLTIPEGSNLNL